MELTKEQMKRVIEELESSYDTKMLEDKFLEEIINLFKKYLNSGEVIWGSEAFIDEVFKTLYGNKFRNEVWSYNDALQKIKNLVQLQEQN